MLLHSGKSAVTHPVRAVRVAAVPCSALGGSRWVAVHPAGLGTTPTSCPPACGQRLPKMPASPAELNCVLMSRKPAAFLFVLWGGGCWRLRLQHRARLQVSAAGLSLQGKILHRVAWRQAFKQQLKWSNSLSIRKELCVVFFSTVTSRSWTSSH